MSTPIKPAAPVVPVVPTIPIPEPKKEPAETTKKTITDILQIASDVAKKQTWFETLLSFLQKGPPRPVIDATYLQALPKDGTPDYYTTIKEYQKGVIRNDLVGRVLKGIAIISFIVLDYFFLKLNPSVLLTLFP
jgi:hypothetical protein